MCICIYIYMYICTHTVSKLCFSSGRDNQNQSITAGSLQSAGIRSRVCKRVESRKLLQNPTKHGDLSAMAHPTSQVISGPYGLIILTSYLILIISFSLDVLKIARLRSDTPR